jgi:RNA polymerase sigma-70 factor (ECF subfamily)
MIYDAYAAVLYGYARSLGAAQPLAEDLLQEVFLRLARSSASLSRVKNLRAYLFASMRRELFRWTRRLSFRKETGTPYPDQLFHSNDAGLTAAEVLDVQQALSKLPIPQREAVVLKVYGLLTFDEIAKLTRVSINTAASRYRYGISKLRSMLQEPR